MEQQGGLPPGFRFSPTDEELVAYYLKNKVYGKSFHNGVIADLDIYKYEPWELSGKPYFFHFLINMDMYN